jgi:hypothetical protein
MTPSETCARCGNRKVVHPVYTLTERWVFSLVEEPERVIEHRVTVDHCMVFVPRPQEGKK